MPLFMPGTTNPSLQLLKMQKVYTNLEHTRTSRDTLHFKSVNDRDKLGTSFSFMYCMRGRRCFHYTYLIAVNLSDIAVLHQPPHKPTHQPNHHRHHQHNSPPLFLHSGSQITSPLQQSRLCPRARRRPTDLGVVGQRRRLEHLARRTFTDRGLCWYFALE
ncbi:hypothetical protein M378DRAFT_168178 [Amanita muscaria Koide BX008]|uniref:Uncharacterized protein n=1 Tax=Amanita muscaria (strain Koide BX008) TaxID=946122 RepID=A0A0C2WVS1_AMAMK|nr:hypothetical protein M378DRAFT_168178 [Amanita muscaria Koide BX008]